jgi:hypothetical protein
MLGLNTTDGLCRATFNGQNMQGGKVTDGLIPKGVLPTVVQHGRDDLKKGGSKQARMQGRRDGWKKGGN